MRRHYQAPPRKQTYIPAYRVTKLEGTYTKTVAKYVPYKDKNGKDRHKMVMEEVKEDRGFLVEFPKGHSIHIATVDELYEHGFGDPEVPLVETDGGEVVGTQPNRINRQKRQEA